MAKPNVYNGFVRATKVIELDTPSMVVRGQVSDSVTDEGFRRISPDRVWNPVWADGTEKRNLPGKYLALNTWKRACKSGASVLSVAVIDQEKNRSIR